MINQKERTNYSQCKCGGSFDEYDLCFECDAPRMKKKRIAQTPIRRSARGRMCTLQIFPHCNNDTETTVLCHLNTSRKGMGLKSMDYFGVYGCSDCHNVIDGRVKTDIPKEEILRCQLRALERTWTLLIEDGLITINQRR